MLDKQFKYKIPDHDEKSYQLSLSRCSNWSSGKERTLIVLQTVPTESLSSGVLMSKGLVANTIKNCINFSKENAKKHYGVSFNSTYAVVNFNNRKHMHLKGQGRQDAEVEFGKRLKSIIKDLKPTRILVSGDIAAEQLLAIENLEFKRGWIHDYKGMTVVNTLDLDQLLAKGGALANLLGYWTRHLTNLMIGKNPFDLSKLKATAIYVDTIEKFDRMMVRLKKASEIAIDTETKNLSVLHNKIYTIQFATDINPDEGFVLPLWHPKTPWSKEDLKYIRKTLRAFLLNKHPNDAMFVYFNGMFDLRIMRQQFKIPILRQRTWEITAGEHLLDENTKDLKNCGKKTKMKGSGCGPGGLLHTYARYGNDHYLTADFSKEERTTTGNIEPSDKNFLLYAATDVVALLGIRKMQLKAAATYEIEGKSYRPYYEKHVIHMMGSTAHQLSHLMNDGSYVDTKYLKKLIGKASPLLNEINKVLEKMRTVPAFVDANARILAANGIKAKSLFGGPAQWAFAPSKTAHLRVLFFDVLGLESVAETKSGAPSTGKEFLKHYKSIPEVALFAEWQKMQKLLSTYVKGWARRMGKDEDSLTDDFIRAGYSFFGVNTGRLNSRDPNFQQIPSHGDLAKIIKRLFIAPKGRLLIRYDYSAHEVRGWSIIAKDEVLANAFRAGQKLRQQWIQSPTDEVKKELKQKGDIHIQNVYRFWKKWVGKDDPMRQAVKAVVFGVLYGKSAKSLGVDIGADEKEAQAIIDKMFSEFKMGAQWTKKMKSLAENKYYVYSIIGRRRNLYAGLTGEKGIISQQIRRGSNAPIQGFASEIGMKAGRIITEYYYDDVQALMQKFDPDLEYEDMVLQANRTVHDANYYSVPYSMVIPFIHMLQHGATYGVARRMEKEFDFKFTVEPEIEIEIGGRDDKTYKWDWSLPNLIECIEKAVHDTHDLGQLDGTPAEVMAKIMAPYQDSKTRKYLQEKYPLLGITKLEPQIKSAVPDYLKQLGTKVDKISAQVDDLIKLNKKAKDGILKEKVDGKKVERDVGKELKQAEASHAAALDDHRRFKALQKEMA
ncbi:exonuclease [Achromobacter phage Motura]|uniref:DNA polymerase n=1 Tax=Achromobacter phage Motura TaxID=2591403 RepID=A0A514CSH1_9CAUD|nr:exonuclease [Achromobacter phage Motura]QDH83419.1 exonuclease [Achromobacter phage Motura]